MLPSSPMLLSDLARAAATEIETVLRVGGTATPRPTGEVSAVRSLVLDGIDQIAAAWEPLLRPLGFTLELTAIFCHSRPHVSFTPVVHPRSSGRCELADLLVVFDRGDRRGQIVDRRAVLIQAKRHKGGKIRLAGGDWTQHELLSDLPPFTFVDRQYDPRTRDLNAMPLVGDPMLTAEYGGIELDRVPRSWESSLPVQTGPLVSHVPLDEYLAGMACGESGYGREAQAGGGDTWSFTVDELIRITGAAPMAGVAVPRGNTRVAGFTIDRAAYLSAGRGVGAGGGPVKPEEEEFWPEGPISVIHLTLVEEGWLG